jgi:transcriptional regulator with XRE-family HTH domain
MTSLLFPALLRYWRERRGMSQLELSCAADVSARHISCLESSRAKPSRDMVLRLLSVLSVPLREQDQALLAAGFEPRYSVAASEPPPELDPAIAHAIERMMEKQEPFPLTVLSLDGRIVRSNHAATSIFGAFIAEPAALPDSPNMCTLLFDPRFLRSFILDWSTLARAITSRVHREHLQRGDSRLAPVLDQLFSFPDVPSEWRHPDFSTQAHPTTQITLVRGALRVCFLVTVTAFSAPQRVALDELRIESCFPLDQETQATCVRLGSG